MKKIFLSFSLIVLTAIFATLSRRNVGVGADRFLSPSLSVLKNIAPTEMPTDETIPAKQGQTNSEPKSMYVEGTKKTIGGVFEFDGEHEDDDSSKQIPTKQPVSTPTPIPTPTQKTTTPTQPKTVQAVPVVKNAGQYKDGNYIGNVADAYYGYIQVKAVISGGKLTDVVFLQYPNDRNTSIEINTQAMPWLKSEAIQIQNANVNTVSGATDSSIAFRESLGNALSQAKN